MWHTLMWRILMKSQRPSGPHLFLNIHFQRFGNEACHKAKEESLKFWKYRCCCLGTLSGKKIHLREGSIWFMSVFLSSTLWDCQFSSALKKHTSKWRYVEALKLMKISQKLWPQSYSLQPSQKVGPGRGWLKSKKEVSKNYVIYFPVHPRGAYRSPQTYAITFHDRCPNKGLGVWDGG